MKTPDFSRGRQAKLAYYKGRLGLARGSAETARTEFADAVARFDASKAKISLNVFALMGLAQAEQALDHRAAAARAAERAVALAESFVEKGAPSYLVGLSRLTQGEIQLAQSETDAAQTSFKVALEHLQQTLGANHPATERARQRASS